MSMEHLSYYSLLMYTKFVEAESVQKWKEFKQQKAAYVVKTENRRLQEQHNTKDSDKNVSQYPEASYQVWGIWLWSARIEEFCQKNEKRKEKKIRTEVQYPLVNPVQVRKAWCCLTVRLVGVKTRNG